MSGPDATGPDATGRDIGRAGRLRREHADLERRIAEELARPKPDETAVGGMKRRKLAIKDELAASDLSAGIPAGIQAAIDAVELQPDHPMVWAARGIAAGQDLQGFVMIAIERDGTVRVDTWAEPPAARKKALAWWAQGLAAHALSIIPFQTHFGWGNGGVPKPPGAGR